MVGLSVVIPGTRVVLFYATADEVDAHMFYRYFFCFLFFVFFAFPSVKKYQTTVLGNGRTDFRETFTKR